MLKRKIIAGLTAMEMLLSGGMPTYIWTGIVPVTAQAENQDPDDQPLEVDEEPTSQEDPSEVSTEKATEASTEKPTEKSTEAPTEVPTEKATVAPTEPPTDEHIIDSGICGEDLTWTLDDEGTLTISGTGDTRWEGCPYWSEYAELIQAVVIEEGVTGIIGGEFYQCHNLTSASLPDTLLTLGGFGDGPRLEEITIPNSVTSISGSAFYGNKFKNIVIPESVKNIGEGAFSLNPLEKIFIMNPDCNIGDNLWTFYDECGIITNTTLYGYPDSTVEAYAKKNGLPFVGLIDFDIYGEDLTWILDSTGTLTISGTGAMPDFKDPSAAPWHKYADSIQDVLIEEGITSIGARAFAGLENLTWVSIPESMTAIGDGAFSGCTSLKGFNDQHDGMRETKDAHMFILEYGVQRIGASAFSGCTNLTAVILPSNLKSIGDGAFSGCDSLKAVFFNNPECEIADSEDTIAPNALIYGKVGSSAETYAAKYDHSFEEFAAWGMGSDCLIWVMNKADTVFVYSIGQFDALFDAPPSSVRKIIFSEGITNTSGWGLIGNSNLNSIIFPESMTYISEGTFYDCNKLKELTIKNPDCEISDKALQYYEGSSDFTLYGYIDSTAEAYAQKHNIPFIGWVACGTFGENLTWSLDGAGTLTISGTGAMPDFADASAAPWHELAASVQRVVVEEGVTRIGENAFVDCDKLLDILILNEDCELSTEQIFTSESVTFYGYDGSINAMRYAKKHNMEFRGLIGYGSCGARAAWLLDDEGVLIISGTGDMGKLSINDKNEAVNDDYYYDEETGEYTGSGQNTGFHTVIIREGVTSIGANAFQGCGSLTSITIADSVKRIETAALSGCFCLHEIQLPDGLEEIGDSAFASCSGLTALTIPDSVTSIGASAFRGCSGLTAFTVPEHVTSLGEAVFKNCYNLTAITIPDSVASIGNAAFQGCSGLATVTLPKNLKSIGDSMFQNSGLTTITIPAGVTGIGKNAFGSCNRLQSITIPKKVAEIGQSAFADCASLTSVTIRDGVSVIAEGAFKNCSSLTSMLIPASVKSIEKDAFKGCDQVTDIVVLNPDCKIIYFPPKATIYGFLDSTAELYAIKNKLNFVEFTDWGTCGKDLIWIYSEGKLMIVGGGKMSWTEEVPWKAHVDEIQTMMIGQGVTDIAASAFAGSARELDSGSASPGRSVYRAQRLHAGSLDNRVRCGGRDARCLLRRDRGDRARQCTRQSAGVGEGARLLATGDVRSRHVLCAHGRVPAPHVSRLLEGNAPPGPGRAARPQAKPR